LDVIAADTAGPGLLAYRREYAGEVVFVVMNTANHSILVNQLKVDAEPGRVLEPVFAEGFDARVTTDAAGHLNMQLPPRAIVILRLLDEVVAVDDAQAPPVMIDPMETGIMHAKDFEISGKAGAAARQLQLLINGNLDEPIDVVADAKGAWRAIVPVRNLGASTNYAQIYAPRTGTLSDRVSYQTHVQEAELTLTVDDPADDGRGPRGDYIGPQHSESGSQREIESAHVRIAGHNLELTLTMAEVTDVWVPPNGFDNVTITTFVDLPDVDGERRLPLLYARMPADLDWDLGHFASGWSSYTFTTAGATTQQEGEKLGVSPKVSADKANRTIRFLYEGSKLGVADWSNASIYVTTWDAAGEGGYRDITPEPGKWYFSGGNADDPRVMDDIMIRIGDSE
ncbi:MAG: glucodextranase DOMON-like domain-containing protein, partial [Pseudomonadota bacterium]